MNKKAVLLSDPLGKKNSGETLRSSSSKTETSKITFSVAVMYNATTVKQ